jgi:uncharacterized cupredoxin-like copper-binding protein
MRRLLSLAVAGIGTALMLSACGLGDVGGSRQVGVTLDEYHVKLSQEATSAGKLTFNVHNGGREKHEFVVIKTDLNLGALPQEGSKIKEDAAGVEHVGELDGVDAGKDRSLTMDLKPGTYVFICNIPDHAHEGMVARFTVQ